MKGDGRFSFGRLPSPLGAGGFITRLSVLAGAMKGEEALDQVIINERLSFLKELINPKNKSRLSTGLLKYRFR